MVISLPQIRGQMTKFLLQIEFLFTERTRSLGVMLSCRAKCRKQPSIHSICYNKVLGSLS